MATTSPAAYSVSKQTHFTVGLTGGIGSGKTLLADLLKSLGAALVDTDIIAHRLTATGGAAITSIAATFGADVIDRSGALDRARMRQFVFDDPTAKAQLELILHPLIRAEAESAAANADASTPYIVFAVPLLVESGSWLTRVDRVLVVDCPVPQQIERVVRSRSLPRSQVESIVAQQATRAQRLAAADDVIVNTGTIGDAGPRAARLHAHYCALARQKHESRQSL